MTQQSKQKKLNVTTIERDLSKRLIAIGDVHGCLNELNSLLEKVNVTDNDYIIFLGDLVDRGPDSEGVIQRILSLRETNPNVYSVMGNHDEKVARYHHHVLKKAEDSYYTIPMRYNSTYYDLSKSSLDFLSSLPHAIFMPGNELESPICFVHAGLSPSKFKQDPSSFIRNRYFCKHFGNNKLTPIKSVEIDGTWYVPEGSQPWYEFHDGKWLVIYGHSVSTNPVIKNNTIGIDTGCVFGGKLTAWVKVGNNSGFVDVEAEEAFY